MCACLICSVCVLGLIHVLCVPQSRERLNLNSQRVGKKGNY